MQIFIPGDVPSSKNSKIKTKTGIFPSKAVKKYLKGLGIQKYSMRYRTVTGYKTRGNEFERIVAPMRERLLIGGQFPVIMGFHFVRQTRRLFDWINMAQIVCDLLVCHRVIPDDDINHLIPHPLKYDGNWWTYNKESPGVIIRFEHIDLGKPLLGLGWAQAELIGNILGKRYKKGDEK